MHWISHRLVDVGRVACLTHTRRHKHVSNMTIWIHQCGKHAWTLRPDRWLINSATARTIAATDDRTSNTRDSDPHPTSHLPWPHSVTHATTEQEECRLTLIITCAGESDMSRRNSGSSRVSTFLSRVFPWNKAAQSPASKGKMFHARQTRGFNLLVDASAWPRPARDASTSSFCC